MFEVNIQGTWYWVTGKRQIKAILINMGLSPFTWRKYKNTQRTGQRTALWYWSV